MNILRALMLAILVSACGSSDPVPQGSAVTPPTPSTVTPVSKCSNPIDFSAIQNGSMMGPLDYALTTATTHHSSWIVGKVAMHVTFQDQQFSATALRTQLKESENDSKKISIDCQNVRPGSPILGFVSVPDSVFASQGIYPGKFEVAVDLDRNGVLSGQASLITSIKNGNAVIRNISDWNPRTETRSIKIGRTSVPMIVIYEQATMPRNGVVDYVTISQVQTRQGKIEITTHIQYVGR